MSIKSSLAPALQNIVYGTPITAWTTTTAQMIPGASVTIVTVGRPVLVGFQSSYSGSQASSFATDCTAFANYVTFLRGGNPLANIGFGCDASSFFSVPSSHIQYIDVVAAGTYTYTASITPSGATSYIYQSVFFAMEIR